MAIFQNAISTPSASRDRLTTSWSPTVRFACASDGGDSVFHRIARDAEIDDIGALRASEGAQRKAVGIDDLAGAGLAAGHHEFVAGCEQGDFGFAEDGKARMVHRRRQRQVAVAQQA